MDGSARCAFASLLLAAAGCIGIPTVTIDGGVHALELDGEIGLSNSASTGFDTIDLSSQLDLGDTEYAPIGRVGVDLGRFDFQAWGFTTSTDGSGTVTADFGNITAGSAVESELDLTLAQGRALFDVVDLDFFEAGLGLAVQWIDFDLDVHEQVFGLDESISVQQPVPLLAGRLGVDLGELSPVPVSVELSAAGIWGSYGDLDGAVVDVELLARLQFDLLGFFVGWRQLQIDLEGESGDQAFDGDVTTSGAVLGLTLRF